MNRKFKTQAMPEHEAAKTASKGSPRAPNAGSPSSQNGSQSGLNTGQAGPKGALAEAPDEAPTSGPPTSAGNNTRRDFVNGPAKGRRGQTD